MFRNSEQKVKSMKRFVIGNLKGGVGKTTLAVNVAYTLAKIEKKKVEANFKTIGTHTAEIKLHQDVKASLKVIVTGE